MKSRFIIVLFSIIGLILFLIIKHINKTESVYVMLGQNKNFAKSEYNEFYYYEKEGLIWTFEKNNKAHKINLKDLHSLNVISIDSLTKRIPYSVLEQKFFTKKLDIFLIDVDSSLNEAKINNLRQVFIEY